VVDADRQLPRALRGWEPDGFAPLLAPGGAVAEALARRESWIDRPRLIPPDPAPPGRPDPAGGMLLLVPLHVRALAVGALVLALPPGAAREREWETARACAGLAALVLEHERAAEEARTARQARDHFLTALNHEIRTPALALTLNAEALRTFASAGVPAHLQKMLASTQTAITTIVRVLEGVLQLGEKGVDPAVRGDVVHPREAVLQLLRRVEPAADRKGLPISFHAQRDLPPLQTDASRFSKVLLHLFSNAIKYTAEGSIEVRVERTGRWIGSGRRRPFLAVRVVDTGPGIPREVLDQMLEPFTQVGDAARTDSHVRGVGLGLPLARRLARSLGGDLLLESDPGRGTVASLFLPYHR
ncbi:MAG TPA: HAMP domain-containing sensor histidine kinase, partial [Longimicrobiaceae bacterium]|nr:HAMP domain-containing sensor histidine kinase [Longimicrobiaceae bacterium]